MHVAERIQKLQSRIALACARSGRDPNEVKILAVSKFQPVEKIEQAIASGLKNFGENYVQEATLKQEQLINQKIDWHFIGRIQSNKVKMMAGRFSIIHSVDRFSIAHHLDQLSDKQRQDIFIQYNIASEESKGGASDLELENLVRGVSACKHLRMLGLMVMPPLGTAPEQARPFFKEARETLQRLRQQLDKELSEAHPFNQLSMGTSHDFEVAIEEGAHWVRIGTDVFGEREIDAH